MSFIKITSRQAVINQKQNIIDFDLPDMGKFSLKDSYINLNCTIPIIEDISSNVGNAEDKGVTPYRLVWEDQQDACLYNVAFVKNAMLKTKTQDLEFVRDLHILQQNLNDLVLTAEQKDSLDYRRIAVNFDRSLIASGLNCELHGEGTVKSREVEFPIKLSMGQVFSLGRLVSFDADKHGSLRVRLELNLDKIIAKPVVTNAQNNGAGQDTPVNRFDYFDTITGTGAGVNTLVLTNVPKTKEDLPYWVNQKVIVLYDINSSGTEVGVAKRITEIKYSETDGKVSLVFGANLATVPNGQTFAGHIAYVKHSDSAVEVESAEVVLKTTAEPMPNDLTYRTWTTEQFSFNGATNPKRIFEVEPNAMTMVVLPHEHLLSNHTTLSSYRISIDNVPTTDRHVKPHTPLYYDKLVSGLQNAGLPLQNLLEHNEKPNAQTPNKVSNDTKQVYIVEPLPMTENLKLVQLELSDNTGVGKLNLYKQVVKTL